VRSPRASRSAGNAGTEEYGEAGDARFHAHLTSQPATDHAGWLPNGPTALSMRGGRAPAHRETLRLTVGSVASPTLSRCFADASLAVRMHPMPSREVQANGGKKEVRTLGDAVRSGAAQRGVHDHQVHIPQHCGEFGSASRPVISCRFAMRLGGESVIPS
jgi:hypothetical protein